MTKTLDIGSDKPSTGYVTGAQTWWLSFMDDDVFRGVVIVQAGNVRQAEDRVRDLGIRPDGECFGMNVSHINVGPQHLNRVLSKEECAEVTPVTAVALDPDKRNNLIRGGPIVTGTEAEPEFEGAAKRGGIITFAE